MDAEKILVTHANWTRENVWTSSSVSFMAVARTTTFCPNKPPATVKVDPNKDLIKHGCREDSGVCICPVTATHKCGYETNQDIEDCSGVSYKCEECNKVCPIKAKEGVSKFTMNWQETWKLACHLNHLEC